MEQYSIISIKQEKSLEDISGSRMQTSSIVSLI